MDFDTAVKLNIYETIVETTRMPTAADVARALDVSVAEVEAAFARLHQKRLLVPEPGDPSRIRMALPFSGIETAFPVRIGTKTYYANCVWDAYGIAAALHQDAVIDTVDGHTSQPLTMEARNGQAVPAPYAVHFAVPVAKWWADIVYT